MLQSSKVSSSLFQISPCPLLPSLPPRHLSIVRYRQSSRSLCLSKSPSRSVVALATEQIQSIAEEVSQQQNQGDDGPIELSDDQDPLAFLNSGSSSPIQSAISILFTGTLSVFLFRSLRRRAKQAKETKFRSSGLQKLDLKPPTIEIKGDGRSATKPRDSPSAAATLQGAIVAGVFAYVLYKFATYVDAGFASKPVSPVYTVRQLTITIRTIVTGLCYLATFVFAANSIGLGLYSIQLALNLGSETAVVGSDNTAAGTKTEESELPNEVKDDNQV